MKKIVFSTLSFLAVVLLAWAQYDPKAQAILDEMSNKFKTYSEEEILYILKFKKINKLKNIEVAEHFNLSRNTVTKWLKKYNDNY